MMLLDPCSWSDSPPVWNLEGGSTAVMDVALQRGAYIHVRLDDPAGLMKAEENKGNRQPVVVQGNASTLGRQVDFLAMAEDSLGRNLRTLVPANTDVQVSVQSSLTVVDKQGNSVAGLAIAAAARATTPAATVVLSVQQ